jgi:acid phosphatase
MKRSTLLLPLALAAGTAATAALGAEPDQGNRFAGIKQIVVIYQENHSFDNLYGRWGKVGGQSVNGLDRADTAHTLQVRQDGTAFKCLKQNDVNLTSPPLPGACTDPVGLFTSDFVNAPFKIDAFIAPTDKTCPAPGVFAANGVVKNSAGALPGGCTRDIVHRFYSEQYQLNGGSQNRYVTGSDAAGLAMGVYDTTALPIFKFFHGAGAPNYVIADNFFQGSFGGSFLNHQWLVAAASPVFANADNTGGANDFHSVVDSNGMPTATPLYSPTVAGVKDSMLTASCNPPPGRPATPPGIACGDFAVNTTQPFFKPFSPGTADAKRLPPLTNPTIGDRLSAAGVDWAWYSGGWSNANGDVGGPGWTNGNGPSCSDPNANSALGFPNCPDQLFQYHHQAFNYFANFAPGTAARAAHLRDEAEFIAAAQSGKLKPVSFIKPIGEENEHPGYTGETGGSDHLVNLLKAVLGGPQADSTLVIVTYDEFGGAWDHVPPPGFGGTEGPHDAFGPGTRIPALLVSKKFDRSHIDNASYDTTSILATVEERFDLKPLGSRDAAVKSLWSAVHTVTSNGNTK